MVRAVAAPVNSPVRVTGGARPLSLARCRVAVVASHLTMTLQLDDDDGGDYVTRRCGDRIYGSLAARLHYAITDARTNSSCVLLCGDVVLPLSPLLPRAAIAAADTTAAPSSLRCPPLMGARSFSSRRIYIYIRAHEYTCARFHMHWDRTRARARVVKFDGAFPPARPPAAPIKFTSVINNCNRYGRGRARFPSKPRRPGKIARIFESRRSFTLFFPPFSKTASSPLVGLARELNFARAADSSNFVRQSRRTGRVSFQLKIRASN